MADSIASLTEIIPHAAAVLMGVSAGVMGHGLYRARARLREQEKELHEARRQKALGTLAGGIAHDFNNILGSIMGFGALLEDDLIAHPELRELARQISIAARRGQNIVLQLMTYSKKDMRDDRKLMTPVSLDALVRENIDLLRPTIRSSSRVTYQNRAQDDGVIAASTQVGQAIINLCINADHAIGVKTGAIDIVLDNMDVDKAMGSDTLQVTGGRAAGEPLSLVNGVLKPGHYARISVSDNGEGMTRDVAERIFDPFFTTKDVSVGTGLGLPAIQGIMHSHGGGIVVTTARFKGTTFALLFPVNTGGPGRAALPAGKALL